jgi:Fe-S cluster assembly protein SufD
VTSVEVNRSQSPLYRASLESLQRQARRPDPPFLAGLRDRASRFFVEHGLPKPKDEAWRFTRMRALTDVPFTLAAPKEDTQLLELIERQLGSGPHIVVHDGRLLSVPVSVPGLEIFSMKAAVSTIPGLLEKHLGHVAVTRDGFAALNSALFEDGVVLRVGRGAVIERPVSLVIASSSDEQPAVSYPRVLVIAEENSELTLVESHLGRGSTPHLTNLVVELDLAANAAIEHLRAYQDTFDARSIALTAVSQAQNSRYRSRVFSFGSALARLHLSARLLGEGAECSLDGLYLVADDEQVDHHTLVDHLAPHTTSFQKYKGIVGGRGSAVFDGTVSVHRQAQATSAHQENRNLIVSEQAVVNTKPHLEIDADNVQCTHAATIGQIEEAPLFYLRARGIDERSARAILTCAFAREMLERVALSSERERLGRLVLERLERPDLAEELE